MNYKQLFNQKKRVSCYLFARVGVTVTVTVGFKVQQYEWNRQQVEWHNKGMMIPVLIFNNSPGIFPLDFCIGLGKKKEVKLYCLYCLVIVVLLFLSGVEAVIRISTRELNPNLNSNPSGWAPTWRPETTRNICQ